MEQNRRGMGKTMHYGKIVVKEKENIKFPTYSSPYQYLSKL